MATTVYETDSGRGDTLFSLRVLKNISRVSTANKKIMFSRGNSPGIILVLNSLRGRRKKGEGRREKPTRRTREWKNWREHLPGGGYSHKVRIGVCREGS